MAVIGCNSSSDVVLLEPRCADEVAGDTRSHLVHVDFSRNTLLENGSLLNATQASCTQLTLEDVKFNGNRCNGQGCVLISTNTELHGIRAVRNRNSSESAEECSFFSIQKMSIVVATDISALKNDIRIMRVHNSSLRIRDSYFARNNRTQASASARIDSGGRALFANDSAVSIEGSTFQNNTSLSGGALYVVFTRLNISNCTFFRNSARTFRGGAIYSRMGRFLSLASTNFSENVAKAGGALAVENTSVSLVDCQLVRNNASSAGACSFRWNSSIEIAGSLFDENRADNAIAGAIRVAEDIRLEIRNSTFRRNQANQDGGAVSIATRCQLLMINVIFTNNKVGAHGGAIVTQTLTDVEVVRSKFTGNLASRGGAIYARFNTTLSISISRSNQNKAEHRASETADPADNNSDFEAFFGRNTAESEGGAIYISNNATSSISNTSLNGNRAGLDGGAIQIMMNSTLHISDTSLKGNQGESGGALHASNQCNVELFNCAIEGNTADLFGGGVTFDDNTTGTVSSSSIAGNKAQSGGGIAIQGNSTLTLVESRLANNNASLGGCLYLRASNASTSNSLFRNSTARNGGAIALESARLTVQDANITLNEASDNGGGIYVSKSSFLNAAGLSSNSNSALQHGGGICLLNGSSFLCYECLFEDNSALNGAGMYGQSNSQRTFIRAQLLNCSFVRNSAQHSGGGLEFDSPKDRRHICFQEGVSCGSIILLNSNFVDNSAVLFGAAMLLADNESVLVSSTFSEGRQEGFLDIDNNSILFPIDYHGRYDSWTGNRVLKNIAGGVVGTYGRRLALSTNSSSEFRILQANEFVFRFEGIQSGQQLPTIQITVLDAFGQSPAPTSPPSFNASIMSPDRLFQGVVTSQVTNGVGTFPEIAALRPPGKYTLKIIPQTMFSIQEATLMIQIRACRIDEEPTRGMLLCRACGNNSYNFEPTKHDGCAACPDKASCQGRYIVPEDGYWHKGPCHDNVAQCIRKDACTYADREGKLLDFSVDFTDCEFSRETLSLYGDELCSPGYEGPLCGSCAKSYGMYIGYECSKCPHAMESVLTLALLVFYLLVISSFSLRGGLPYRAKYTNAAGGQSVRSTVVWNSSRSVAINVQMIEMMRDGYVPPEVLRPRQSIIRSNPELQQRNKAEMTGWKTSEIFKITINFLQVTAAVAGVAVHWTDGIVKMFKVYEIFGALTTVALFRPVDCIFPSNSALVRSLWRTMFGLFAPAIVVGLFIAYWGLTKIRRKKPMSFLWKRSILSVMVVVYISYLSLAKLAVRSFYCVEVFDSEDPSDATRISYWAIDTAIMCYGKEHVVLLSIGVMVLVLVTLFFPLITAFHIARYKEQQEVSESWTNETMGFLYRAFTKNFRYWESVVMLRKACLSVIVVFAYPLGGQLQTMLALLLLMFSLCLQTTCKPYRQELSVLNHYEYLSLFVSCVTLTLGQFLDSDRCSSLVKGTVAFTIVFMNTVTFLVLFLAYLSSGVDHLRAVLQDKGVQIASDLRWWSVLKIGLINKMSQWCGSSN